MEDIMEGKGVLTYANGAIYDGEWKDGNRDGKGVYTWADGKKMVIKKEH
jgi:hypothetical protein